MIKKFISGIAAVVSTVAFCYIVSGCASSHSIEVSRYLQEYEENAGQSAVADAGESPDPGGPDRPVSGLPSFTGLPSEGDTAAFPSDPSAITIQPDAVLQVTVEEDPTLDGDYPVNGIGAIDLKYIGPVFVYNRTEKDAERKIESVLRSRDFRKATVNIRIIKPSYDSVKIAGQVNRPQIIKIGSGDSISLNDALLRAGGLKSGSVRTTRVKVVRAGQKSSLSPVMEGEEYRLVDDEGNPRVPDVYLKNSDIAYVYVENRALSLDDKEDPAWEGASKTVLVLGEVKRKGKYVFNWSEPATVMNLIFKMGGLPKWANAKKVTVVRRNASGTADEQFIVNAKELLKEGNPDLDFELQDGDRVVVPSRTFLLY